MGAVLSLISFSTLSICHHPSAHTLTQARNWVAKQSTHVAFTVRYAVCKTLHHQMLLSSLADRPETLPHLSRCPPQPLLLHMIQKLPN